MASDEEVLENKIKPILEKLTAHILKNRPENIPLYMIEYLQKVGNITSSGLTYDEKHELESLRKQVQQYRQIEAHIKNNNDNNDESQSFVSDSEEDDVINNEEEFEKKVQSKKNNFKDKKRSGVSAEVYGNFNKKEDFVPRVIEKTEEQKNKIKLRILTSFLFNSLEKKDLEIVINAMDEKTLEPDEFAIKQGDNGDCLFVVESGELECTKHFTKDGEEKHLKDYFPGDSFGELALLYNAPRAASIRAKTKCTLWVLDRETFNNIVKEASQKKRERYENFLKKVDILSTIDAYEIGQISEALKSSTFLKNDYIIKEGELGDVFYILEEGPLAGGVEHRPRRLRMLHVHEELRRVHLRVRLEPPDRLVLVLPVRPHEREALDGLREGLARERALADPPPRGVLVAENRHLDLLG